MVKYLHKNIKTPQSETTSRNLLELCLSFWEWKVWSNPLEFEFQLNSLLPWLLRVFWMLNFVYQENLLDLII